MNLPSFTNKCLVCGDKAIGTNFNVKTCESCKVFFRRNALNYEKLECLFENNCIIDVLRRKFCKKCRLKKCLSVGMKKEWILSEEERRIRKIKIDENRKRKLSKTVASVCDSTTNSMSISFESMDSNNLFEINNNNNSNPKNYLGFRTENFTKSQEYSDFSNYVLFKSIELELSVNPIIRPLTDFNQDFNDIEFKKILEMRNAARSAINKPFTKITNEFQRQVINAFRKNLITGEDIEKLMAIYMEQMALKSITFGKNMSSFMSLCENDKIALIKYGCIEICSIRSVRYFNFEQQYWTLVVDSENSFKVKLDLLKSHGQNTYLDHKNFLNKIGSLWDSDDTIIDLLSTIVLFNPDRPTIIHKEMIKFQQHVYMYLLQRYLFLKYRSECEAKTKFLSLMNCLTDLYALNIKIPMNWSKTDPQRSMPLMSEICDRNIPISNLINTQQ